MAQGLLDLVRAGTQVADGLARLGSTERPKPTPPVVVRSWPQFREVRLSGKAPSARDRAQARWLEARRRFDAAPSDEAALADLLNVCELAGDPGEAHAAWAVFLDQPGAQPAHRLGYARWLLRAELRDEALAQVRALALLSTPPRGTASLLGQLLVTSQPKEARAALQRAVKEDPSDTDAAEALAALPR